jgi:hypothetical protein
MTTPVIDAPKGTDTLHEFQEKPTAWSGVFAWAVCAFALMIASEFLPVSLLTVELQE